jgi:uncharacterized membrane protein YgcG
MGTAGRSAPLRRTGSLLGLLGAELAAVLALHWLGRWPGLRIRWDEPVPWLLSSPVQEVLGAILRTVGLVMAYWLLASTVVYLLASLTRLPGAVRAVAWATLPLARRVADRAVAVTLATSMVGGTTLGVAGPALAAEDRGGAGPPAREPVAAAQVAFGAQDPPPSSAGEATDPPAYVPDPAGDPPTSGTGDTTPPPTSAPEPTRTSPPAYVPHPADQAPRRLPAQPSQTTEPPAARQRPTTSESTATTRPTTTTAAPTTTPAPTTTAAPRQGAAASTSSTTGLRPPAYEFNPATPGDDSSQPRGGSGSGGGGGSRDEGSDGGGDSGSEQQEATHPVARGDNLWAIARDHLSRLRSGGSGEPTNREVAEYWLQVIEANRDRLRSGDPDLIYPGEEIVLPPPE